MKRNLLGFAPHLTTDDWAWFKKLATRCDSRWSGPFRKRRLLNKTMDEVSATELLLLDGNTVLAVAEEVAKFNPVYEEEKIFLNKLRCFIKNAQ